MILSNKQKEEIKKHSEEIYPEECCGFVLPDTILKCNNQAKDKISNFTISPVDYLKAKDLGAWAVYHSHPDSFSEASLNDKFNQKNYQMPLIIFSGKNQKFKIIRPDESEDSIDLYVSKNPKDDLTESQKETIKKYCLEKYPEEACGLGLKNGQVVFCENKSSDKINFFAIQQSESEKYKEQVEFVFHSHCKDEYATFSDADEQVSTKTQTKYILYNVLTDEFKCFLPQKELAYIGRTLVPGVVDCSSLAQDYYKKELNINFPTMNHPFRFHRFNKAFIKKCKEYWQNEDAMVLVDFYLNRNFIEVSDPRKHDIILSNSYNFAKGFCHISIYLGEEKVLDYARNGISAICSMQEFESKSNGEIKFLRHKSLL